MQAGVTGLALRPGGTLPVRSSRLLPGLRGLGNHGDVTSPWSEPLQSHIAVVGPGYAWVARHRWGIWDGELPAGWLARSEWAQDAGDSRRRELEPGARAALGVGPGLSGGPTGRGGLAFLEDGEDVSGRVLEPGDVRAAGPVDALGVL